MRKALSSALPIVITWSFLACSPHAEPAAETASPAQGPAARPAAEASSAGQPALAVAHATQHGGATQADTSMPSKPIPQPAGGTSVAEIWANRKALSGKSVTVRGKVVKFNGGIMGRNWIHIQDGTGKPGEGTHDLTITTDAPAKVGDVIMATGIVAVDKDFTAGYKYAVIVEGATLK